MSVRRQRLTGQKLSCLGWKQNESRRGRKKSVNPKTKTSISRHILESLRVQAGKQKHGKLYVVFVGRKPGIYSSWGECEIQVKRFSGAVFKSYPNSETAVQAIELAIKDGTSPV